MKLTTNIFVLCCMFISVYTNAQQGYPIPKKTNTHLFYVQHSNNHNTYVYEAKLKATTINKEEPLSIYRVVYTNKGEKKPLTSLQKSLAYGIKATYITKNLYKLNFAASNELNFYLALYNNKPRVYVTINNKKIWLERIFIMLNNNSIGLKTKTDYILFYGKDVNTNTNITLKHFPM